MKTTEPAEAIGPPFAQVNAKTSPKFPKLPKLRDHVDVDDYRIVRCVK